MHGLENLNPPSHRPFQNQFWTTPSSPDYFFSSTILLTIRTTCKIYLPSTKAPWDMYMVSWRTLWTCPNKTLVMILYRLLTSLIGLKFEIFFVRLFFGIKAMKVASVLWFIIPLLWNFGNALSRSSLITSQHSWNTEMVNPLPRGLEYNFPNKEKTLFPLKCF